MKYYKVIHKFVDKIPEILEEGTIYISIPFATAVHKCFCGCGVEVVTPLSPTDWRLIYDGDSISLHPSIGNWSFDCQSHYWIIDNEIEWSRKWSKEEIDECREDERNEKEEYLTDKQKKTFSTRKIFFKNPHKE